jgi:hypothetical protein
MLHRNAESLCLYQYAQWTVRPTQQNWGEKKTLYGYLSGSPTYNIWTVREMITALLAIMQNGLSEVWCNILCWVDRASWIMCIITNSMHCLSLVYWINTPLHVRGVSTALHQEVECVHAKWYFWVDCQWARVGFHSTQAHCQSTWKYHLACTHSTFWWRAVDTPLTCRGVLIQ